MDLVLRGWTRQFQQDQGLAALSEAEAFETFAGYSVLCSCYEDDFSPDQFRMGAGGDLGVDVAGIVVNGDLLSEAADVRDAVEKAKHLDVHSPCRSGSRCPRHHRWRATRSLTGCGARWPRKIS